MSIRLPFRYLEPTFFSGLVDDPLLLVRIRPLGRSLLFDCGQIHHLAKRILKSIDVVFISHAHMDHFMGVDTLVRNVHVSPRTIDFFGPPGLGQRLAHKLSSYDWNLAESFWCSFRVHEIFPERIRRFLLQGPAGFPLEELPELARRGRTIYQNPYLRVEAELCDHKIPVLIFKICEAPAFEVDPDKLRRAGYQPGPWLRELNRRFAAGELGQGSLSVPVREDDEVVLHEQGDLRALYEQIRGIATPASIGYVTDIGMSEANRQSVEALLSGVTVLCCECTYLRENRNKARNSWHLCTDDVNELLASLKPRLVLPMHLSKTYLGQSRRLYEELSLPTGCTLLRLDEYVTPRPLLPEEIPWLASPAASPGGLPGGSSKDESLLDK